MDLRFWKSKKHESRSIDYINPDAYNNGSLGLSAILSNINYSSLSLSAFYAATELISNSVAELPLQVKLFGDNKESIVKEHPVYHLFDTTVVNKFISIKSMLVDMIMYGNGFAYIKRKGNGIPLQLIYCPCKEVTVNFNPLTRDLYYIDNTVAKGKILPKDMIHIVKDTRDGVNGVGLIELSRPSLKLAKYTEKAATNYFDLYGWI